jgi:hypothetical protein
VKDLRKTPATLSLQPSSDLPPDHRKMVKEIYNLTMQSLFVHHGLR